MSARILVADDNEVNLELLVAMLESEHYVVSTATDGLVSESESEWLYYIIETLRKGQASLLMRSCTEAM